MIIKNVNDSDFKKYGKVLTSYNTSEIIEKMLKTPVPADVIYEPSIKELEALEISKELMEREYGGMPIQIGYCNGNNICLNAVEYHRSSEINIAVGDIILLLGKEEDMNNDFTYDTSKIEAFLVPSGTVIEVYATTLHYAPCNASDEGFRCVVVLPEGTNLPLEKEIKKEGEDALLFAKNKWLVAHKDSGLEADGAFIGLKGENIKIER